MVCSLACPAKSTAWCTYRTCRGAQSGEEAIAGYKRGDQVRAKVLDVDVEKERISLGIKQLENDPFEAGLAS